jgi:hypothetical protein
MGMIDLKGSAIAVRDGMNKPGRDRLSVDSLFHDAIEDVEVGVEFWNTLCGNHRAKRGYSPEFLNRIV